MEADFTGRYVYNILLITARKTAKTFVSNPPKHGSTMTTQFASTYSSYLGIKNGP